jgi:hypothetical protein
MPLAFQNKVSVWVKDLPVMKKTEITEYDWEDALTWVLHELQQYDWHRLQ